MNFFGINQTPYGCTRRSMASGGYSFAWPETRPDMRLWWYGRKDHALRNARKVLRKDPRCQGLCIFSATGIMVELVVRD